MKPQLLLCGAILALFPCVHRAQEPGPVPERPAPPDLQQRRDVLRDLPPEERRERLREWQQQNAPRQFRPGPQPYRDGSLAPAPGFVPGAENAPARMQLVLTPEQRQSLREAAEADRDQVRELQEQLRQAREAVEQVSIGKFDEPELRQRLEAKAKLETELAVIRARNLSKIEPPLTAQQIEAIKNALPGAAMPANRPARGGLRPLPGDRPAPDPLPPRRPARQLPPQAGPQPGPDPF